MSQQAADVYDNAFYDNNVYGHALSLLSKHRVRSRAGEVHVDLGCGYGRIAEPLTAELGLTYIGVDADEGGLASLRQRGFEAHQLCLGEEEKTFEALRGILDGRTIASMTMLDTLEHLVDGDAVLRVINRLAAQYTALVVISVPNVAHSDIGFKLALGRWDYTEVGLLDHTHRRLFGSEMLGRVFRSTGLYPVDTNDVRSTVSDQHFPADHPALARGSELHSYLAYLREGSGRGADVNQFVWLCAAGRSSVAESFLRPATAPQRPFLSAVMRTQGRRMHTLTEALTALAGQTDTDFEVIVVGHRLALDEQKAVERAIEDCPEWLRAKSRLVLVHSGNRTRPLNEGFAVAAGRYIAILDDDDMPFGHWVETFRALDRESPGRLLRAVAVCQEVGTIAIADQPGLRAFGKMKCNYPERFDFVDHLRENYTPPVSVAFPRGVFHDLGLQFDELLTTTEDWDYILRTAAIVGTTSSPEITGIYRWWPKDENSRTVHPKEEWQRNHFRIFEKLDDIPVMFPRGTTGRIRSLLDVFDQAQQRVSMLAHAEAALAEAEERIARLEEVTAILESTSWLVTSPLRLLARLVEGRPAADYAQIWKYSASQLEELARAMRRSTSWRVSAPLRWLRGG
jgi:2-polyprenyl-3-methyl-5-hydroxy-6-metoxy-1,4-benzoquinol methylase